MANNPIYPIAYQLHQGQTVTLYYLGFPAPWKQELLELQRAANPKFRAEYNLPTNALKKIIHSWLDHVIALAPLSGTSDDSHWMTSLKPYTEENKRILCDLLKTWITATYIAPPKLLPAVKQRARAFSESLEASEWKGLEQEKECLLCTEDQTVSGEAYQAIPLMAVDRLTGKDLLLHGTPLHLCYAGKNELVTAPLPGKNGAEYSLVLQFSVQTIPPRRHALLLCHISTRRWVPGLGKKPYFPQAANVHIRVSENRFCIVPIEWNGKQKDLLWKSQEQACYDLYAYDPLPDIEEYKQNFSKYKSTHLIPYKPGMGVQKSSIEPGVSVRDKAELYQEIAEILFEICAPTGPARQYSMRNIPLVKNEGSPEDVRAFRSWAAQCAQTNAISFELYGLWDDPLQAECLGKVRQQLEKDFGENDDAGVLRVQIGQKPIAQIAAPCEKSNDARIARVEKIANELGRTDDVVGCIVAIPGPENYTDGTDPKDVIRAGFAKSGRVVQFLVPDAENDQNVFSSVLDLYRQLGIFAQIDTDKIKAHPLGDVSCVGMHVCTQIHGVQTKGYMLPLFIKVDLEKGITKVTCDAFERRTVNYREACLEMAKLFWHRDLDARCRQASFSPAKQQLIALKNQYDTPEKRVLLLVTSDDSARQLWKGISDAQLSEYRLKSGDQDYQPEEINVGDKDRPYMMSLGESGVRIIRVRCSKEVPDYITEEKDETAFRSSSGIYQFEKDFWAIPPKPNDPRYSASFKRSKTDDPRNAYAQKDMIELYPIQLQPDDDPLEWVRFAHALRSISIQYSQTTIRPLPLHLAEKLEEYLFQKVF